MQAEDSGHQPRRTLVIGASSAIARALIVKILSDTTNEQVVAVSRSVDQAFCEAFGENLEWIRSDYTEFSIDEIVTRLTHLQGGIQRVFICNGVLHDRFIFPEKRLEELRSDAFSEVFHVNALIPILWIKHIKKLVKRGSEFTLTVFSARVASINDNQRGGWYSYRTSKAALNMLLMTASIEYSRLSDRVRFLAFHPGTTDTPLSKPFQKSVSPNQLFSPEFVAGRLLEINDGLAQGPVIQYLDWNGKNISW